MSHNGAPSKAGQDSSGQLAAARALAALREYREWEERGLGGGPGEALRQAGLDQKPNLGVGRAWGGATGRNVAPTPATATAGVAVARPAGQALGHGPRQVGGRPGGDMAAAAVAAVAVPRCARCGLDDSLSPGVCCFHPALLPDPGPLLYCTDWHACRGQGHTQVGGWKVGARTGGWLDGRVENRFK